MERNSYWGVPKRSCRVSSDLKLGRFLFTRFRAGQIHGESEGIKANLLDAVHIQVNPECSIVGLARDESRLWEICAALESKKPD